MSIAPVGYLGTNFSSASPAPTAPAGSDGDILLAWCATDSNHTILNVPTGWTQVGSSEAQAADTTVSAFRKFRSGTETAFTFTDLFDALENGRFGILAYSGVDLTTPLDVTVVQGNAGAATGHTSASITPVTAGAKVVSMWGTDPGADPRTVTVSDHTGRVGTSPNFGENNGTSGWIYGGDSDWTSGAVTHGITFNASDNQAHFVVALRPADLAVFVPKVDVMRAILAQ